MMKTFLLTLVASIATLVGSAQFFENFDQNTSSLSGNCWVLNQINYTTTSTDVINGTGSAYTNPPTSGSGERTIATPVLNMTSTSLSVSFKYKTSAKIAGQATRTINIGITDKNGIFMSLQVITMDKNTSTSVLSHNATYTIPAIGTYRLELRIGGATGDGNSRVIFDDLSVSASAYYGPVNHCNPAAIAVNDSYPASTLAPVANNVLLNDQMPNDNETYTAVLLTSPTQGTLVLNPDGSFVYTPDASFTNGTVSFTYYVVDNGYAPSTSNIATVNINFAIAAVLPVKLLSFTAALSGKDVELKWKVAENETGDYFEIEKSTDGNVFTAVQKIFAVQGYNVKEYTAIDAYKGVNTYYRIKIVNKDNSRAFSKVMLIKPAAENEDIIIKENPVFTNLNISFTSSSSSSSANSLLSIYSVSGAKLHQESKLTSAGTNTFNINVDHLSKGMYVLTISNAAGKKAIQFIKK